MEPPVEEAQGLCPDCLNSPCLLLEGLHGSLLEHYEEDLCDDLEGLPIFDTREFAITSTFVQSIGFMVLLERE